MSLKKWGEVKIVRGNIGGLIGLIIVGALGLLIMPTDLKLAGLIVGLFLGYLIGHSFDPQKTVIFKEEE
jgi:hypothetical protein